jgi:hypothetical protein
MKPRKREPLKTIKITMLTLEEAMSFAGVSFIGEPFIKYDPDLKEQYRIKRVFSHDGTLIFSIELMQETLHPLINRISYYKPDGEPPPDINLSYVVGPIKRVQVFGKVIVPAGRISGERECIIIPVTCIYF